MLNPQFVAGEHGFFGGHKSEDIRTFFLNIFNIENWEEDSKEFTKLTKNINERNKVLLALILSTKLPNAWISF